MYRYVALWTILVHSRLSFKKNDKTKEFYTYIGSVCSEPTDGPVIENLLKNIGNTGSFSFPNQKCR